MDDASLLIQRAATYPDALCCRAELDPEPDEGSICSRLKERTAIYNAFPLPDVTCFSIYSFTISKAQHSISNQLSDISNPANPFSIHAIRGPFCYLFTTLCCPHLRACLWTGYRQVREIASFPELVSKLSSPWSEVGYNQSTAKPLSG